ncbi:hypothetical protein PG993_014106 [Apiospora rasikravindrae]|uniref:Xylanolytic transcriptional activator regulatory domain-containing protein n=1 Tax=Apiospora rasikravindrae TaxID=990691 RepID=A0ABR1RTM0_9PEZI
MEDIPAQPEHNAWPHGRRSLRHRGRPILSCRECRRRKIRCDHKSPGCTPADRDPASPAIQEEDATYNASGSGQVRGIPTPASLDPGSNVGQPTSSAYDLEAEFNGNDVLRRLRNLEEFVGSASGTSTNKRFPPPTDGVTQEWQVIANKSRDQGKARKTGTAQEFGAIIACFSEMTGRDSGNRLFRQPEVAQSMSQAAGFLRQCKTIAKELKTSRPTRGLTFTASGLPLPPRETTNTMVNLYFAAFESTHRILHIPSFWEDYRTFWDGPETVSSDLRLKVLLVMSIGSSLYNHGSAEATLRNTELAHQCIFEAETWLGGPLEKDRICITGLQIQCLTILARQIFSIGGDTVWVTMGSLIHAAMQLGLHRDPKHLLQDIQCLEAEIRRRLWATILDFAVQAALDSAMPPRISMDDFDAEPPANINDDELDESTSAVQPHPKDVFTSTSIQITLLEALPIRLRIVQLLHGLHSNLTYQQALDLSAQLIDAVRTAHSATKDHDGATVFHKTLLDYLIRRFMIPLHYPFSNQARTNPMYYYSLKLTRRPRSPDGSRSFFARLTALGGGLFRAGVRAAITALTLDLLTRVQEQRLDGTLARHAPHRAPAKQAVRDLIALSEERVRLGETNVKGHMFLCMILAQVEAVEEEEDGVAVEAREGEAVGRPPVPGEDDAGDAVAWAATDEDGQGVGAGGYELDLDWDTLLPDMDFT